MSANDCKHLFLISEPLESLVVGYELQVRKIKCQTCNKDLGYLPVINNDKKFEDISDKLSSFEKEIKKLKQFLS